MILAYSAVFKTENKIVFIFYPFCFVRRAMQCEMISVFCSFSKIQTYRLSVFHSVTFFLSAL